MTPGTRTRRLSRSIGALLAGFVLVVVLSIATDAMLHATGIFPPLGTVMSNGLFALATVYRTMYGIAGSYITARLAPDRPMQHALAGGAIGLGISIMGAAATWNTPSFGPHWYPLALVALAMPCSWAGGMLWLMQLRFRASQQMTVGGAYDQEHELP